METVASYHNVLQLKVRFLSSPVLLGEVNVFLVVRREC